MTDQQQQQPEYARQTTKADVKAAKAHYKASRPWYKKKRYLIPLGLLVLIVIISASNSGGGSDKKDPSTASSTASESTSPDTSSSSSSPKAAAPKPAAPKAMKVRAATILKDFEDNEAAADAKYKDKTLRVTGIVDKVDTEFIDEDQYVIQLGGGGDFEITTVNCDDQTPSVAAKIKKGDRLTVLGEFEDGGDLGIELKGCKLAS